VLVDASGHGTPKQMKISHRAVDADVAQWVSTFISGQQTNAVAKRAVHHDAASIVTGVRAEKTWADRVEDKMGSNVRVRRDTEVLKYS
jgi:hypothetical protein